MTHTGLDPLRYRPLVRAALDEDIGPGDLTVAGVLGRAANRPATASVLAKAPGVVAGLGLMALAWTELDDGITVVLHATDSDTVQPGDPVATVTGPGGALLSGERTALNLAQQLSGTATLARRFVEAVAGTQAKICDTRKTVPGWRELQKYAAACGGAHNHRHALYDQVLIKENHLAAAGCDLSEAIRRSREAHGPDVFVGAEAETLAQMAEALAAGADMVLLDNFPLDELAAGVERRDAWTSKGNRRVPLEASGGISLATVRDVAATGVDRISVGAITHSAPALDLSCLFDWTSGDTTATTPATTPAEEGHR